ncbi:hypothetical protein C5167_014282 [Papaver somniferum]|uniref:protein-serine/threonine phosphatase n=1 Tax=Papaver somniferum TaxID=3469 RepID=A0A4Y7J2S5_PAPSO|nr:hypothetical protein C5167_014282 [Papaver somniferum]
MEMARLLDPGKIYFDSRVISQADCTQKHQKGLDVVLGAESAVIILDDKEYVWGQHKENLILVDRYHYFASSGRSFNLNNRSLSELKRDESEPDGALATILEVLKLIHHLFFDLERGDDLMRRDVRQVLKTVRNEVLRGCKLVFSRVWKKGELVEKQRLWVVAEELGAICCKELDASVTHVVATDSGTENSRWAVKHNKFLVLPSWIEAANFLWKRQPEDSFAVNDKTDIWNVGVTLNNLLSRVPPAWQCNVLVMNYVNRKQHSDFQFYVLMDQGIKYYNLFVLLKKVLKLVRIFLSYLGMFLNHTGNSNMCLSFITSIKVSHTIALPDKPFSIDRSISTIPGFAVVSTTSKPQDSSSNIDSQSDSIVVKGVTCKKNVSSRWMISKIEKPHFLILGGAHVYQLAIKFRDHMAAGCYRLHSAITHQFNETFHLKHMGVLGREFHNIVAWFRYALIDVHSVDLPPSKLDFSYGNPEWVKKEVNPVQ